MKPTTRVRHPESPRSLRHRWCGSVGSLTTQLEQMVADGRSTPGPKQKNDVSVDIFKDGK